MDWVTVSCWWRPRSYGYCT